MNTPAPTAAPAPASSGNPLMDDLGMSKGGTDYANDPQARSVPESPPYNLGNDMLDLGKHAARGLVKGAGDVADIPYNSGTAMYGPAEDLILPDDLKKQLHESHPMAHMVAEKLADRLAAAHPALRPSDSAIGRAVEGGVEAVPSAIAGGASSVPELLPTMLAGSAGQMAKDAGGGPLTQVAAEVPPLLLTAGGANQLVKKAQPAFDLNTQTEAAVNNITSKLAPNGVATGLQMGKAAQTAIKSKVASLSNETGGARDVMDSAVGGKKAPVATPSTQEAAGSVTKPTGDDEVDAFITNAKTKKAAKVAQKATTTPTVPTSYSTDGDGFHSATSDGGETHAVETATGDLKVTRHDASGPVEDAARLNPLAYAATAKGKNLVSGGAVSPGEAASYEKLGRQGWDVQKNPNASTDETGSLVSDSPKNPVYTVKAPATQTTLGSGGPQTPSGTEGKFTGEWTYNPKTGQSEPVVQSPPKNTGTPDQISAQLNPDTPMTWGALHEMKTKVGQQMRNTSDPIIKRQLKPLYDSMDSDMRTHAASMGPEAEAAYDNFNATAKFNAADQKTLNGVLKLKNGTPITADTAFKKIANGSPDDAGLLTKGFGALSQGGKDQFRATVLNKMGREKGSEGAPYDANTFLSSWRTMTPESKDLLFGTGANAGPPGALRKSLDSLADTVAKDAPKTIATTGGHGTSLGFMGLISGLAGHYGGEMVHLVMNHPITSVLGGAATGGTMWAVNKIMPRVLSNPRTVGWLAQAAKAPKSALPMLGDQLNQMAGNDPDAKDLADLIMKPQQDTK